MLTGPPPKIHGTRDILPLFCNCDFSFWTGNHDTGRGDRLLRTLDNQPDGPFSTVVAARAGEWMQIDPLRSTSGSGGPAR